MRRVVLRGSIAAVLALGVGACAATGGMAPASPTAPATGAWQFARKPDPATGKPSGSAFVLATRVTLRTGKIFERPAGLQLQCFKDKPIVLIKFTQRVGSNRSASLTYRFNDKPERNGAVRFLPDYQSIVIEEEAAVRQFVAELRTAERLLVNIDSLITGDTRAIFPVAHAEPAIASAYADCPLPPSAARRSAASIAVPLDRTGPKA